MLMNYNFGYPFSSLTSEDKEVMLLLTEYSELFYEGLKETGINIINDDARVKGIITLLMPFRRKNFINLIKGISYNVKDIERFKEKYKKYEYKRFIENATDDALQSKTIFSALIFSQLIYELIDKNLEPSHKQFILSEIIRDLHDFDLINFISMYEDVDLRNYPTNKELIIKKGYDAQSIALTGEKLKNLYLHTSDEFFAFSGGIIFNEIARELYNFLMSKNIKEMFEQNGLENKNKV